MPVPVWSVERTVHATKDEVRAMHRGAQPLSLSMLRHLHQLAALPIPDTAALEQLAHELEPLVALINSIHRTPSPAPHVEDVALFPTQPAPEGTRPAPGTEPLARDALLARTPRSHNGYYLSP